MRCLALFGEYTALGPLKREVQPRYISKFGLRLTGSGEKMGWLLLFSDITAALPKNQVM
jgi:hypothetical protein